MSSIADRVRVRISNTVEGVAKTPVFVVGVQRSGTTMLIDILDRSPLCKSFQEVDERVMRDVRLREAAVVKEVIRKDYHPLLVFKPINDSQHADSFIRTYEGARLIWVYRDYNDVVNSALVKWAEWQKRIVLWVRDHSDDEANPTEEPYKWFAIYRERITPETVEILRRCADDSLTDAEGAALLWYMRNILYFDQQLEGRPEVMLVKYEDLVREPAVYIKRVFDFVGCRFRPEYIADVRASSIARRSRPELRRPIRDLCDGLQERLDAVYQCERGRQQ